MDSIHPPHIRVFFFLPHLATPINRIENELHAVPVDSASGEPEKPGI